MNTKIKTLQLKALTEFPDNPQNVPEEKMSIIKHNMRKNGWYAEIPLVWYNSTDDKTYIVSGNHRVQCAIDVGILEQRCIVIEDPLYTWERAKKDVIMFNTLHGDPDELKLKDFVNNIVDEFDCNLEDFALDTGMSEGELSDIIGIDFQPDESGEVSLDSKNTTLCPECGHEF